VPKASEHASGSGKDRMRSIAISTPFLLFNRRSVQFLSDLAAVAQGGGSSSMGIILFQAVVIIEQVFFPWAVDTDKQVI
jgi:hypothetical protein